jgi:secreted protein with Ig-like and vWFA domain
MPIQARPVLDADHAAFLQRGVALSVASCGHAGLPSLARVLGCRIDADGAVRILLSQRQGAELLVHVTERGQLALVLNDPASHRTLQLKASDAVVSTVDIADLQAVARYRVAHTQALVTAGFEARLADALLACPDAELAAIAFTPGEAYAQTPGPNAGQALLVHA